MIPVDFVPVHPAAQYAERYGYRKDEINGEKCYVTTDDHGRAMLGPRRHRAGKRPKQQTMYVRALPAEKGFVVADTDADTVTILQGEEVPVPEKKRGRFREWLTHQRHIWRGRMFDPEWHEAARHTAVTALIWAMGIAMAAVFLKGAYWVVVW